MVLSAHSPLKAPFRRAAANATGVPRTCLRPSTMAVFLDSFNKCVEESQTMQCLNVLPAWPPVVTLSYCDQGIWDLSKVHL